MKKLILYLLLIFGLPLVAISYAGPPASAPQVSLLPHAGTDIASDLEEEAHGDEHAPNGADPISTWYWGGALTVGDATPYVQDSYFYDCTGGTTITITQFVDTDGDESDFTDGFRFGLLMNDSDVTLDFSDNANIEGNANTDFTGSSTQVIFIVFTFRDGVMYADLSAGLSNPTTLSVGTVQGQYNVITDADGITLTAAQMNSVLLMTGTGDVIIPDVCDSATGTWITIKQASAFTCSIDVAAAEDDFYLSDGTAIDGDANEIDLAGNAGSQVTLVCIQANKWWVMGEIGLVVDGGADD